LFKSTTPSNSQKS